MEKWGDPSPSTRLKWRDLKVPEVDVTPTFLTQCVGKHFLALSYRAAAPGELPREYFASCFVIDVEGLWVLITAGHVIKGIKDSISSGITHSGFLLHDVAAGHSFKCSVPITFDPQEWTVLEDDRIGADYAAWPIHQFFARGLAAGGIQPLTENAWGEPPFGSFSPWLMAGAPSESTQAGKGGITRINLVALVLDPVDPPAEARVVQNRTFARIRAAPGDKARVKDIAGMSGGPVYGVRTKGNIFSYWVIGVQSSWLQGPRIISFCGAAPFFAAVKDAVRRSQQADAETYQSDPPPM